MTDIDKIYQSVSEKLGKHLEAVERAHGADTTIVVCQRLIQDLGTRIEGTMVASDDAWDREANKGVAPWHHGTR